MNKSTKVLLAILVVLAIVGYLLQIFFPKKEVPTKTIEEIPIKKVEELDFNKTSTPAQKTIDIGNQGKEDIDFSKKIIDHTKKYPWYQDFPIVTPKYTIVYDYDLKSFRIRLQIPESSSLEKKVSAQEEAIKVLKEKLTDFNEWEYHFLYSED